MDIVESRDRWVRLYDSAPGSYRFVRKITSAIALNFAISILFFSIAATGRAADDKLTVYVVNYPLQYFAERIAGDHAVVVFPAPAGIDPAFWTPDVNTIGRYQQADLILLNGAGYARWVARVSLPRSRMVNTSAGFKDQYIPLQGVVTHSHGAGSEHAHGDLAFTTWIDFNLAAAQAGVVADALSRKKPGLKAVFQKNYTDLKKDLLELDQQLKAMAAAAPNQPLVGSHPVYDYLAAKYGLNIQSVHWEPDVIPGNVQWKELGELLKEHPAKWMIWEGAPAEVTLGKLKSMGIESLVFDPCGNVTDQDDFLAVMRANVSRLKKAF